MTTAIFIISNAIKLTLYARRREIRIMKLVGATNWFIRVPLIIEGVVFGAAGAFVAWLLLRLGRRLRGDRRQTDMPVHGAVSQRYEARALRSRLIMLGVIIGAAGSFVSIRRFLHD